MIKKCDKKLLRENAFYFLQQKETKLTFACAKVLSHVAGENRLIIFYALEKKKKITYFEESKTVERNRNIIVTQLTNSSQSS